jgi:hypothetical protein
MAIRAVTPVGRVSYPYVFKAQVNKLSGQEEFSLQLLFPAGTDLTILKKLEEAAKEAKWGKDKKKWPKNLRSPIRSQDDKEKTDDNGNSFMPPGYEKGGVYLNLKSKNKPQVVDAEPDEFGTLKHITEETEFYPGCWARVSVSAFAYDQAGNRGVSFALNNIQKVKDGDRLGGVSRAEDDFKPIPAAETASDASQIFS